MKARNIGACAVLMALGLSTSAPLAQELKAREPDLTTTAATPSAPDINERTPAPAEPPASALDGRFYGSPMFSCLLADKDRDTRDGLGGSFAVGKGINDNTAFELIGYYVSADGKGDGSTAKLLGGGASFLVFPRNSFRNAYGIVTATYNQARDHPGADSRYGGPGFEAGPGYLFPLGWHDIALRVEAKIRLDDHRDKNTGSGGKNEFYDGLFNAGLYIPLGPTPTPAEPAPMPAKVIPLAADNATVEGRK